MQFLKHYFREDCFVEQGSVWDGLWAPGAPEDVHADKYPHVFSTIQYNIAKYSPVSCIVL